VTAGALAAAVTLVIVFALEQFGVHVHPEVASALTLIFSVAAGYLKSADGWHSK
jgi:hypothetical protein